MLNIEEDVIKNGIMSIFSAFERSVNLENAISDESLTKNQIDRIADAFLKQLYELESLYKDFPSLLSVIYQTRAKIIAHPKNIEFSQESANREGEISENATKIKKSPLIKAIDEILGGTYLLALNGCLLGAQAGVVAAVDLQKHTINEFNTRAFAIGIIIGFFAPFIVEFFTKINPVKSKELLDLASEEERSWLVSVIYSQKGCPDQARLRILNSKLKKIAKSNQRIAVANIDKAALESMGITNE